ncbi:MAG: Nucleoside-diphosphate-sugar epimerase [Candidatus Gottesmanbacteria bacterium GW2011_GWA1_34_13]|uniref:Nucleoside-diphosphate-sugar epimerase n=1 Tax=Candidatus Gottesmanbacteria bacterium GW2011_GWA1_34_13 TaxID=1618434 RepID=A0A0G0B8D1_9BACT|nr:MAG: Nucleoside-diphosphate-sugar epimerase [Candidatus Gottesmanbacteria bacterium GW2011_GWA1_34_13]
MKPQTILITGALGFIGYHTSQELIKKYKLVIGIDNIINNYSQKLKKDNLKILSQYPNFEFKKIDILDYLELKKVFLKYKPQVVIHLAALTGVRNSITNPKLYEYVNIYGTKNVYKLSIENHINKFIFSSSSSVYGNISKIPFKENGKLHPNSPYAKSKLTAEKIIIKLYKKHKLPTVILRFFSVYGPHGRPDMAPYIFTKAAYSNKPVIKYGPGNSARDFTYIDDIVQAIIKCIEKPLTFNIFNIGNSYPITLNKLILYIEKYTKNKLIIINKPIISAESKITYANIDKAKKIISWKPKTKFSQGIKKFVNWYKNNRI